MEKEEVFKEIGDLSKVIRKDLFKLIQMSQNVKMRKFEVDAICRSLHHLDKFRSRAEDFMLSKDIGNLGIFYPDDEDDK
ncbi:MULTISPECIES: hypothetical protein [unclassified Sporosarcina]|uniref:hypothetical protein n=1 Tax=unclassified Sporosarcina TaxID=2647733 RepID=UPI00203D0E34|nr:MULTISPECIES: hypothetical protein [unclassified Sporosarcina]GKV65491.1 hypothetical protein NCCP2331_16440 [Sporosarcina sp. NCCP-2331]GLB55616.1 hypothetical protein NCCP2378_14030 [Sporosarcina sp. NCCP-2378]